MKIVVAPDKFKDCLTAPAVAQAIAAGLRAASPDVLIDLCPMADGGEGTVDALVAATAGRLEARNVTGPLPGMHVNAHFGLLGDGLTAVVEMASASGLHLLSPRQRNPLRTTTFGTGELLRAAVQSGARRIILGIGGSATVDGGIGCAQAFGARIELDNGSAYTARDRKLTGGDLLHVSSINTSADHSPHSHAALPRSHIARGRAPRSDPKAPDRHVQDPHTHDIDAAHIQLSHALVPISQSSSQPLSMTAGVEFIVACDVANPLTGDLGAARIFGPQKGASPQQVEELDRALAQLARRVHASEFAQTPGAGAAGGLGFGMLAFFGASLRSGIEIVMEASRFRQRLVGADLCITGEGKLDAQSLAGKTAVGVARVCKEMNVPCVALAGAIAPGAEQAIAEGLTAYFSICDRPMTLDESVGEAAGLLSAAAANLGRLFFSRLRTSSTRHGVAI